MNLQTIQLNGLTLLVNSIFAFSPFSINPLTTILLVLTGISNVTSFVHVRNKMEINKNIFFIIKI